MLRRYCIWLYCFLESLFYFGKMKRKREKKSRPGQKMPLWFWLAFGAVTGLICALSGAGGPILVMPLLVVFGVPVKTAVGIALFNSIFIAVPSSIGYAMGCRPGDLLFASAFKPCKPRDWRLDWKQKYLPDSSGCAEKRCSCIFRPAGHSEIDYRLADPR